MDDSQCCAHNTEPQTHLLQNYGTPGTSNTYEPVSHHNQDFNPSMIRNTTTAVPRTTKDLPLLVNPPYHLTIACILSIRVSVNLFVNFLIGQERVHQR